MEKRVLVADDPVPGFPGLVQAGPFLFTSGCDGHRDPETGVIVPALADAAEAQCEISYAKVCALLACGGVGADATVRLDHYVSSQEWLLRRGPIRARIFGAPAPLASTGVAATMAGINMLTTAAIAVTNGEDKRVLVSGEAYGMGRIASLVAAGPFLFLSGIRATLHPRPETPVPEETPEAFGVQTRITYRIISDILAEAGADPGHIVRLDRYIRDRARTAEEEAARRDALGAVPCASTTLALPLGMRGEVEITTLAAAPGTDKEIVGGQEGEPTVVRCGGFVFVGACAGAAIRAGGPPWKELAGNAEAQVENALAILEARLESAGSGLGRVVRLDAYLRDINFAERFYALLRRTFGVHAPVVVLAGAELEGIGEVTLNAVAC
jgi:enamine deaminase RidA (YjgF/YER057c/UK114 family)